MSQCQQVHDYIKQFGSITPLEAMRDLGIMRLGARIHDLKQLGFPIVSEMIEVETRFGTKTRVAQYSMPPKGQQELNF